MSSPYEPYQPYPPHHQRRSQYPLSALILPLLLLLILVGVLVWFGWRFLWPGGRGLDPNAQLRPVAARGELAPIEKMNIEIYEQVAPSVVHVTNLADLGPFRLDVQQVPKGTGSGFVWDEDGHIVTNYHVVEGADAAQVVLADHSSYKAQRIWAYPDKDIAVLSIKAPQAKLHPILIGSSHDLKVGQLTYAIGNPFGLDQSLSSGIVSALNREIEAANGRPISGVIQTTAPINPGNSGGPLLDSSGRLIGMNTAIVSPSGAFAGIGFAIPVDEINPIVTQLIREGKVVRPRLGVQVADPEQVPRLGVKEGVLVMRVLADSPAAKAGLEGIRRDRSGNFVVGDVIVAIDQKPITSTKDLYTALEHRKVGDTVTVTVERGAERLDKQVTLEAID